MGCAHARSLAGQNFGTAVGSKGSFTLGGGYDRVVYYNMFMDEVDCGGNDNCLLDEETDFRVLVGPGVEGTHQVLQHDGTTGLLEDEAAVDTLSGVQAITLDGTTAQSIRENDFIKTSTGKESVNATLPVTLVMIRAIRDYFDRTGFRVGYKPAGGISKAKDALVYLAMMKEELGDRWLQPDLFRFGASSLLGDIERQLDHHVSGSYSASHRHAIS